MQRTKSFALRRPKVALPEVRHLHEAHLLSIGDGLTLPTRTLCLNDDLGCIGSTLQVGREDVGDGANRRRPGREMCRETTRLEDAVRGESGVADTCAWGG